MQGSLEEWAEGYYIEQKLDVQKDEKRYKAVAKELHTFRSVSPDWAQEFDAMRALWWILAM